MGGKGGSSGPSIDQINQQAYAAGASGQKWNDITGQIPYGHDSALQSWLSGQKSVQQVHTPHFGGFEMPHMAMPHIPSAQDSGVDFDAQMKQQQEALRQQEAERQRIAGQNQRDQLYAAYMDAAGSSTDYINSQINQEIANAKLLGIDYQMDDEIKTKRISDYFASVWGEGEQGQLEALMKQWGNPAGFKGFTITRGDASKVKGQAGGEEQVSAGVGQKPKILLQDEEEQLLGGAQTLLGE